MDKATNQAIDDALKTVFEMSDRPIWITKKSFQLSMLISLLFLLVVFSSLVLSLLFSI